MLAQRLDSIQLERSVGLWGFGFCDLRRFDCEQKEKDFILRPPPALLTRAANWPGSVFLFAAVGKAFKEESRQAPSCAGKAPGIRSHIFCR
jgi:hypothetical protein